MKQESFLYAFLRYSLSLSRSSFSFLLMLVGSNDDIINRVLNDIKDNQVEILLSTR